MFPNVDTKGFQSLVDGQLALGLKAVQAAEQLSALQIKTATALINLSAKQQQALLTVKKPQEFGTLINDAAQPFAEISIGYVTEATTLAIESGRAVALTSEAKVQSGYRAVSSWLDEASKSAPAGSEALFKASKDMVAFSEKAWTQFMQQASTVGEQVELYVVPQTTSVKPKGRRAS